MMPKWTQEQQEVITHRGSNLLVAAAAGSGKTAVLVERIISMITDAEQPVSLEELLVMTFTEAAASEMRERIRSALEAELLAHPDNAHLIREVGCIQNANINTIDAFCKRLITENYAVIDLDPGFRIGDQGELKLLQGDIIEGMLEAHYGEQDPAFLHFMDAFTGKREDAAAGDMILQLYQFAQANPWPEEWLRGLREEQLWEVSGVLGADTDGADEGALQKERKLPLWEQWFLSCLQGRLADAEALLQRALSVCEEPDGPESYRDMLREELAQLHAAAAADNIADIGAGIRSVQFGRLKPSKSEKKGIVTNLRNGVKKDLQKLREELVCLREEDEIRAAEGISSHICTLVALTEEFGALFAAEKAKRHMLDFNDLEHFALGVLYTGEGEERRPSPIADDYAMRFREILVDEYQDSNHVQEALIQALSAERFGRPDVFQVGDVKQSIYSFRLARPDLFLEKYQDADYPKIELSKNFRSRREVIDTVNDIFFRIMMRGAGGIDYTEDAALHLGRVPEKAVQGTGKQDISGAEGAGKDALPVMRDYRSELLLTEINDAVLESLSLTEEMGKAEAEAEMIAERIKALLKEGYQYKDIVILMRSPGSWADKVVEVLGASGIPAYADTNEGYFNAIEVETVLALLGIIDNPRQDIPLAAVMRSPIYGFTDEELAAIVAAEGSLQRGFTDERGADEFSADQHLREMPEEAASMQQEVPMQERLEGQEEPTWGRQAGQMVNVSDEELQEGIRLRWQERLPEALAAKLIVFWEQIDTFREQARYLRIHELLYQIYNRTGYYNYVSAMPAGAGRRANLDALVDYALNFEGTSYKGLFHFIRYIEKLKKYESDQGEASIYSEQDDLVRIMSIHKSKGLQFPVVFVAGLARRFNKMDLSQKLLIDPMLGAACDYMDMEYKVRIPSLKRVAVKRKLEMDQLGEELRVLYVALTRAQDKLIMTGCCGDVEKQLEKYCMDGEALQANQILAAGSMLDWVMMAEGERLLKTDEGDGLHFRTYSLGMLLDQSKKELRETLNLNEMLQAELEVPLGDTPEVRQLRADFDYLYPYEAATELYPKHSVSEVKEAARREYEGDPVVLLATSSTKGQGGCLENSEKIDTEEMDIGQMGAGEDGLHLENMVFQRDGGGAARGNAYHRALAFYDFNRGLEQLEEILSEKALGYIDRRKFLEFLETDLAKTFTIAENEGRLFREQHFMKEVSYHYLFPESGIQESVLLQGIIDAFVLEKDGIVLVDYKTDHASAAVLKGRYQKQLDLYADALYHILGKPVKKKLIYSFHLSEVIPLP